jgi:hypothetical protein
MSAQLTGKVAVFNINGTLAFTGSGMLATDEMTKRSATLSASSTATDLDDDNGDVIATAYTKRMRSVDITFVPYDPDTPGSLAGLEAKIKLPVEGSIVTLAGWDSPDFNGDWNFASGEITPQKGDYLQIRVRLERKGNASGVPAALTPQ